MVQNLIIAGIDFKATKCQVNVLKLMKTDQKSRNDTEPAKVGFLGVTVQFYCNLQFDFKTNIYLGQNYRILHPPGFLNASLFFRISKKFEKNKPKSILLLGKKFF
jgi:hypothetical protein